MIGDYTNIMKNCYNEVWQSFANSIRNENLNINASHNKFQHIVSLVEKAHEETIYPCCVLVIAHHGIVDFALPIGSYKLTNEKSYPIALDSIFDLASLTKVVATWFAIGWLEKQGLLDLHMSIAKVFPEIESPFSKDITIEMLMTYLSGLSKETRLDKYNTKSRDQILKHILGESLENPVNSKVIYSNRNLILLGEVVSRLAKLPFEDVVNDLWDRNGMHDTYFNPPASVLNRVVSTEFNPSHNHFTHGVVHDENAQVLGGVAGHAGAFSTAKDLLLLASMALSGGRSWFGEELLHSEYVTSSFRNSTKEFGVSRGLIWDLGVYGSAAELTPLHHGFSGTSLLLSPKKNLVIIFLTNAVQISRDKSRLEEFRRNLYQQIFQVYE